MAAGLLIAAPAMAADMQTITLSVKDQSFVPQNLSVPAGQKVKLVITNQDKSPVEFESYELSREKVIPAEGQATLFIGPLDAGTYKFFDDFHREKTMGTITVK
jgi:hypothetical protein